MNEHEHHGPTTTTYLMVFGVLAVLTTLTVVISYSGMADKTKEILSFVIAGAKALLVALIFMHLRFESRIIAVFAIVPVLLAILFILAISPDIGIAG